MPMKTGDMFHYRTPGGLVEDVVTKTFEVMYAIDVDPDDALSIDGAPVYQMATLRMKPDDTIGEPALVTESDICLLSNRTQYAISHDDVVAIMRDGKDVLLDQ
jgi:hypothetical protein